jgi:predicted P-loop ATPase
MRKSTLAAALASEAWFTDDAGQIGSKDAALNIEGRWIVELAELSSVRKADTDTVKAFISRRWDKFRPPYGRLVISVARQSVFFGTTNDAMPLVDRTGNRRFWAVNTSDQVMNIEALKAVRDQLWAEAAARYQQCKDFQAAGGSGDLNPYRYWPEGADLKLFAAEASKFEADDSLSDLVDEWLDNPIGWAPGVRLTTRYVMTRILGLDRPTRADELRAITCLAKAGFKRNGKVWATPPNWTPKTTATPTHLRIAT